VEGYQGYIDEGRELRKKERTYVNKGRLLMKEGYQGRKGKGIKEGRVVRREGY
jgi:hypothetical protein